jgi:hypothetical protein
MVCTGVIEDVGEGVGPPAIICEFVTHDLKTKGVTIAIWTSQSKDANENKEQILGSPNFTLYPKRASYGPVRI